MRARLLLVAGDLTASVPGPSAEVFAYVPGSTLGGGRWMRAGGTPWPPHRTRTPATCVASIRAQNAMSVVQALYACLASQRTHGVCVHSHGAPVSAAQHHSACRGHLLEVNTYCPRAVPATYIRGCEYLKPACLPDCFLPHLAVGQCSTSLTIWSTCCCLTATALRAALLSDTREATRGEDEMPAARATAWCCMLPCK
jgi:hypothetical protein